MGLNWIIIIIITIIFIIIIIITIISITITIIIIITITTRILSASPFRPPQSGKAKYSSGVDIDLLLFHIRAFLTDSIWVRFPRTGKMSNMWHFFFIFTLYCDQMVGFFQVFSTVLKRLCPLDPKNTFVLVLAIFLDF